MIYVFTSAAWNYLPKSQLLAKSVKRFMPKAKMVLGLPDEFVDDIDFSKYGFDEVIPMEDSLVGQKNYYGWVFSHTIVELATAIKPFVLTKLLSRPDCEAVVYFDPDIVLFSDMNDMLDSFKANSILLCPHVTIPEVNYQSIVDNELGSLKYGVFNFGYVGVKNDNNGRAFAEWWRDRCGLWCYDDIPNGVFTDQKWSDLVPCLFDGVKVLRSPRFDVATWNTTRREFAGNLQSGFTVNGERLGFYHFTGFDAGWHDTMLERALAPKIQKQLTDWYKKEHAKASNDPLCQRTWAFLSYSDGSPIPKKHRAYFHTDMGVMEYFKNPFDVTTTENNYRNWYARNIEGTEQDADTAFEMRIKCLTEDNVRIKSEMDGLNRELETARCLYEHKVWEMGKTEEKLSASEKELETARDFNRQKISELEKLEKDFQETKDELARQLAARESMESSLSWRITKPLRAIRGLLGRAGK